jgi:hypothetical protein
VFVCLCCCARDGLCCDLSFASNRAQKALVLTGNKSAEAAMDWLVAHEADADIDAPLAPGAGAGKAVGGGASAAVAAALAADVRFDLLPLTLMLFFDDAMVFDDCDERVCMCPQAAKASAKPTWKPGERGAPLGWKEGESYDDDDDMTGLKKKKLTMSSLAKAPAPPQQASMSGT